MKKLSLSLLAGLIALGLLSIGSTNAMTYTVEGNTTQVAIPEDTSAGITIDWGDGGELVTLSSDCGASVYLPDIDVYVYKCTKTYDDSTEHTITVNNNANTRVVLIYLNSSNINNINNFNGFSQLNTIYLKNNQIEQINSTSLNGLGSNYTIYLNNNEITKFLPSMTNIKNLYLNDNQLETIPSTIWDARSSTQIQLTNSISYGDASKSKLADLKNNPINFIGITSTTSTTTNYSAQWFGYTYDDSILDGGKITYDYKIFPKNNESDVRISDTIQENNGTNISKNISLPSLEPGTYTFKVCIDGTENICDQKDFSVSYTANIEFTNKPNSTISSINNISFSRRKTGTYPDEFIDGYKYTLKKGSTTLYSQDSIVSSTSYTPNVSLFSSDPNGDYTFTVTLWDTNGTQIDNEGATFNITIDDNIIISSPSGSYNDNGVYTKSIDFNWTSASSLFSYYDYYITKNSECTTSNIITSGNNITSKTVSFSYPFQPGTYLLCITLHNSNGTQNTNNSSFSVNIPSTLTIESPSEGQQTSNNINFRWNGFSPFFDHYEYTLNRTDKGTTEIKSGTGNTEFTGFQMNGLHHGEYEFIIAIKSSDGQTLTGATRTFQLLDDVDLSSKITSNSSTVTEGGTIASRNATFSWSGKSEDFVGYTYSVIGTTFEGQPYNHTGQQLGQNQGSITLSNLQTGRYKFTITMIDSNGDTIISNDTNFNVKIPATLKIKTPSEGATITSDKTTFSWEGYSDVIEKYGYALTYGDQPVDTNNFTNNTTITSPTLKNGTYTLTVWIISGVNVAQDTVHFTVAIPPKVSGGSSSKTHYSNNLKLSVGNDSPTTNEWIKLIVKIDDTYVGKVSFPKLQYYDPDTQKRTDIPVTSKNYVSDYSDDAKLGYIKFSSSDDGRKDLSEFIKFSKNGYYRIYAEDKDGYDEYVEIYVGNKKATTNSNTTNTTTNTTTTNNSNVNSIIREYLPEIFEAKDTQEEVYIARSCKKYTIQYSASLNVYTSPNLNMSEYFVSKDYFKRYIDSKNKYQSGCPTNIGWISTNYADRSNDDTRYTAPNGKVYFITGQGGNYYSDELNKELKTPTSFRTIQELKYYIRDRNPLISMAALGPTN